MKNIDIAKSYVIKAIIRLKILEILLKEKDYSDEYSEEDAVRTIEGDRKVVEVALKVIQL